MALPLDGGQHPSRRRLVRPNHPMRWQHNGLLWGKATAVSWAIAVKKARPSLVCNVVLHR